MGLSLFIFGRDVDNLPINDIVYLQLYNVVRVFVFWFLFIYVTKSPKKTWIFAVFELILVVIYNFVKFYEGADSLPELVVESAHFVYIIGLSIIFALFGVNYFKSLKGLLLGVFFLIEHYSLSWTYMTGYLDVFANLTGGPYGGLFEFFTYNHSIGEGSYRQNNVFELVLMMFGYLKGFIFLWFAFKLIERGKRSDLLLRTLHLDIHMDTWARALVHWTLRFFIVSSLFSGFYMLRYIFDLYSTPFIAFSFACFAIVMYMLVSLYRNNLTLDFVMRNRHPSWLYYFINVPFVHFFFWLILWGKKVVPQFKKGRTIDSLPFIENMKEHFSWSERNVWILVLTVGVFVVRLLVEGTSASSSEMHVLLIGLIIYVLLLFTLYKFQYGNYILYGFLTLVFSVSLAFDVIEIVIVGGPVLLGLIIFYPLFHFDKFDVATHGKKSIVELD